MPSLPWRGWFIEVSRQGEVEWRRCAHCGRELTDAASRERGYGPDCARWGEDILSGDREHALEEDRQRWRHDLEPWQKPVEELRRRAARDELRRREPASEEQEARWAVLQAALARRERAVIDRRAP